MIIWLVSIADVYYEVWTVPYYVKVIFTVLSLSNENTFKWNKTIEIIFQSQKVVNHNIIDWLMNTKIIRLAKKILIFNLKNKKQIILRFVSFKEFLCCWSNF